MLHERDVLKQERDFYKMQYQSLKSQQQAGGSGTSIASGSGGAVPPLITPGGSVTAPLGPPGAGPSTVAPTAMGPMATGVSGTPPPRPQSVPIGGKCCRSFHLYENF